MKKAYLTSILCFCGACMAFCGETNLIKDSDFSKNSEFWKLGRGWSVVPNKDGKEGNSARLTYTIKTKWSKLTQKIDIAPEAYYRLTFDYRCARPADSDLHLVVDVDAASAASFKFIPKHSTFKLGAKWAGGTFYFHNSRIKTIGIGWYLQGRMPNVVYINNVSLVKLAGVGVAGKNFVVNPKFENGVAGWKFPAKWGKLRVDGKASIDPSVSCLDGKQSLRLDTSGCASEKNACAATHSGLFPVLPGKIYTLEFWAKAEAIDTPLVVVVDSWIAPFIPPHWYKINTAMLDKTLRKYAFVIYMPEIRDAPALTRRLVFLKFALLKRRGTVWVDNVRFAVKK